MKHGIYFLCLVFLSRSIHAQDSTVRYDRSATVVLKLAPLSILFDPDATIQGGAEFRVSNRNSVQVEAGFGRKGFAIVSDDKKDFTGWSIWRARSEWRHYTNHYRTNKRKSIRVRSDFPLGNYLALEGFIKHISGTENSSMYIGESMPTPFEQSINRFVWGGHAKWGRQIAMPNAPSTSLSRVILDIYAGVGIRYGSTQTNPRLESCGCGFTPSRFAQGSFISPSVSAGIKIGFVLFDRLKD